MIINKKLFAILTLVCFMFTLMPVAAMASDSVIDTEAELKAAIEKGGEVVLGGDITLTETTTSGSLQPGAAMIINKALTIDGAGHTITITSTAGSRGFAIINTTDVQFKNAKIISNVADGRCIDTRTKVNVTLDNVTLEATGGNSQPLTIGGSTNGTSVTLNNTDINAGSSGYPIISFVKADIDILSGSDLAGYCAVYFRPGSDGSTLDVKNSSLTGKNIHSGTTNAFGSVSSRQNVHFICKHFMNNTHPALTVILSAHSGVANVVFDKA